MKKGVDYVGVTCVFFCHDGKGNFLLHKRSKNCRDEVGRWDCGGGALEVGESFEDAVKREVLEEYCVNPAEIERFGFNNVLRKNKSENTHWVAVLFAVKVDPKVVQIGEPEKMEDLGWFPENNLPKPLHSMFDEHFGMMKSSGVLQKYG